MLSPSCIPTLYPPCIPMSRRLRDILHVSLRYIHHVSLRDILHVSLRDILHVSLRAILHVSLRDITTKNTRLLFCQPSTVETVVSRMSQLHRHSLNSSIELKIYVWLLYARLYTAAIIDLEL